MGAVWHDIWRDIIVKFHDLEWFNETALTNDFVCAPKAASLGIRITHVNTSYIIVIIMYLSSGRYVMWDTNFHVNYPFKIDGYNNCVRK